MKLAKEIKMLRKAEELHEDNVYPGYPFLIHGIVDMKNETGSINLGKFIGLNKFIDEIHSKLCYHMVGNYESQKGSWLNETHMENHKKYLKMGYDDFYIDNLEVTKMFFALFAAIRECKGKSDYIYFGYDGDADFAWVERFHGDRAGTKEEKIRKYLADYYEIKCK